MTRHALLFLLLLPAAALAQGTAGKGLDALRGTWVAVSAAGKPLPSGVHSALVVGDGTYKGMTDGKVDESGTITVNSAATPATIDLAITEGSHAGKTQLGVVEVSGDTMTLVLASPGAATRPEFTSQNKLVLTRLKPLSKELEGPWEGTLETSTKPLRIAISLSNGADGLLAGRFVSLDQGGEGAAIPAVLHSGTRVTLIVPAVRGSFEGELKNGELTGIWTQRGGSLPLSLKRAK